MHYKINNAFNYRADLSQNIAQTASTRQNKTDIRETCRQVYKQVSRQTWHLNFTQNAPVTSNAIINYENIVAPTGRRPLATRQEEPVQTSQKLTSSLSSFLLIPVLRHSHVPYKILCTPFITCHTLIPIKVSHKVLLTFGC